MDIIVNHDPFTPDLKMLVPGRRALGEDWSEVTIGHRSGGVEVHREDTDAPADRQAKIVPIGDGMDMDQVDYILTAAREKAAARGVSVDQLSQREKHEAVNEAWQAWMEQKLAWGHGRSSFGAGGHFQRERTQIGGD